MFVVQVRRGLRITLIRMIGLASRRRLIITLAFTTTVLVFTVCKMLLSPRYAVFGLDRHPSVMRLLESDIFITRLDENDDENDDVKTAETVGVFLAFSPSTSPQTASQPETARDHILSTCSPSYRYQIFLITSVASEQFYRTPEDETQYGDGDVNAVARQLRGRCIEAGSTSVVVWQVLVSARVAPSVVADLVTEAYVDNVTWYDVIFVAQLTSPFPVWDRWPPTEITPPSYVGAAVKTDDVGSTRIAFHRTHLDIFGDCWPHRMKTSKDVAKYLKDIYADSAPLSSTVDGAVDENRAWLRRQVSTTTG